MSEQCKQVVRAGHQCPRAAKRDGFCDSHWLKRFGHFWNLTTFICERCQSKFRESSEVCLMSPYLDQPPSVYPEPVGSRQGRQLR